MDRVDPENQTGQPGAWNFQPSQYRPNEQRVGRLKKNVEGVITSGMHAKKVILNPEYSVSEREIICGSGSRPNFSQAGETSQQRIRCDQRLVVPNETCTERGQVSEPNRHDNYYGFCRKRPTVESLGPAPLLAGRLIRRRSRGHLFAGE